MSRALLLVLCATIALANAGVVPASAQEASGKKVALLIGVNKYDKRGFNDLSFAERDVEELASDLRKANYEVQLLTGSATGEKRATLKNIQAAMGTVFKGRTKADLVLVALAGHGLQIEVTNDQGKLQAESSSAPPMLYTHAVGGKRANDWGLHDMRGNVWEWCRDWYKETLSGGTDPEQTERASFRVFRGGSWSDAAGRCRSAFRLRYSPDYRGDYLGFRVALVQSSK